MGEPTARRGRRRTVAAGLTLGVLAAGAAGLGCRTGAAGGAAAPTGPRAVPVRELRVGDCFSVPTDGPGLPSTVTVVPCGTPHLGEVYATAPLQGLTFPGGELESHRTCETLFPGYVLDRWALPRGAAARHIDPPATGGRAVTVCVVDLPGSRSSSVRQDRYHLTDHQLAYLDAENAVHRDLVLQPGTFPVHAPEAYREWIGALARATSAELEVLGSRSWGDRAAAPKAALAGELEAALGHLRAAGGSTDPDAVRREVGAATRLLADGPGTAAFREAIGLPSTPPAPGLD
ncbi:hypothetical protein ACIA8O_38405 [Kitasatospora sp. NPDC051853]|uniref:hypothetical protein n=1 Tax=Kitasatospora sp. NPDC051853 TaxID=3364058 RepID=UPI0037A320DD